MKTLIYSILLVVLLSLGAQSRPQTPEVKTTEEHVVMFTSVSNDKPVLNGVTIHAEPFVRVTRNRKLGENPFEGYLIDVLNYVSNEANFGYSLKMNSLEQNKRYSNLIEKVKDNKFDFALADLTMTEDRKKIVDFTLPIHNITLGAVVRKVDYPAMNTLKEAVEATVNNAAIKYGIIGGGPTEQFFTKSTDPFTTKIWQKISADNRAGILKSYNEGYEKVRQGNFIFFSETHRTDYVSARECDLKTLPDNEGALVEYKQRQQGIVVKKGLAQLEDINKAIKKMTDDGTLAKLQDKYWKDTVSCRILLGP